MKTMTKPALTLLALAILFALTSSSTFADDPVPFFLVAESAGFGETVEEAKYMALEALRADYFVLHYWTVNSGCDEVLQPPGNSSQHPLIFCSATLRAEVIPKHSPLPVT